MPAPRASTSRPRRASHARRAAGAAGAGPAFAGTVCGAALVVGVLLPWYTTNLGPPFSATSASGWEATSLARVALVLGALLTAAAALTVLDARGMLAMPPSRLDALAWVAVVAAGAAVLVVGYRLLVMPEPAEFLSRQIGIYLSALAAVGGVLAGLGMVALRR
ncbi:hypothetical protein [Miltoncostaea marina]|uniref:hypothetical protein n=1 Tax=Miltoncostaea marina TaxID=2843215 RepID=UPI001C3D5506|nr:hypothetical protein [Miltoncostaea marina]